MEKFIKDPEAVLDYQFDWHKWLEGGEQPETIVSHEITVPSELILDRSVEVDGSITVWLSEGVSGKTYRVECKVTTNKERVDERSIWVTVQER